MRSISTILQVAQELDYFESAVMDKDTIIINEYLSMLYDDYDSRDINFVLSIVDDWNFEAIDFLTAAFCENFKFMHFKIFEENKIKELLKIYAEQVLRQLNITL